MPMWPPKRTSKTLSRTLATSVPTEEIRTLARDYRLSLEAENKAPSTISIYSSAIERFAEWLEPKGKGAWPAGTLSLLGYQ